MVSPEYGKSAILKEHITLKQAHIIAGPNGSGKTTFAREFIEETGLPFVNADDIAYKLAPDGKFEHVRIKAGKLFFHELREYRHDEEDL